MWVGQRTDLDRLWKTSVSGVGRHRLGQWEVDYGGDPAGGINDPAGSGFDLTAFTSAAGELAKVYLSVEQMRFIQEENERRLAAGLPLLSEAQIAAIQPQAGVSVGVAPGTQNMLYIAIAVIAAVILLPQLMKRR